MARPREQADREKRITYEAVVDAYGESERAMGWYYYMKGKLTTPFAAECKAKRSTSPLAIGESVHVIGMADEDEDEDDCMAEILVLIKYGKSQLAVPLDQLKCLSPDAQTCEAVDDWHYWVARGYGYGLPTSVARRAPGSSVHCGSALGAISNRVVNTQH